MVSEDKKPVSADADKLECGDNESIKPAESSSPSSSVDSVKLSPGAEKSSDSSTKDDYDFQATVIDNATFTKIEDEDSSSSEDVNELQDINETEYLNENSLGLISQVLKENCETCDFDPATWLQQTYIDFTNKFDKSTLFMVDSDSKLDKNLTIEDSMYENMDDCWISRARNHLADYQVMRGTPRDEYNFCTLIKLMGHASGHSLQALYTFMLNIFPVLEIFLHITRFILDKTISIKNSRDTHSMFINSVIFGIELIIIYICINVIFGYIVSPVIRIPFGIIGKILLYT